LTGVRINSHPTDPCEIATAVGRTTSLASRTLSKGYRTTERA